jgi:hypothetical protein
MHPFRFLLPGYLLLLVFVAGCGGPDLRRLCEPGTPLPSRSVLSCAAEFDAQAARPMDSALPGAFTIKTIVDQANGDAVHFLDTNAYPVHRTFAVDHLGFPPDGPFVNEYFYPQRRFLLGSVTYYEEPGIWAYELAPYDTASNDMIALAFRRLSESAYFGKALRFRPTSENQAQRSSELPADVPVVTTEELQAGISYQPLTLGETCGRVHITTAVNLPFSLLGPRDLVVLDRASNDLVAVAGVVVSEVQAPLADANLRASQRPTPFLVLRDASEVFAPLFNQWACLTVGAFDWQVTLVTEAEADAWFAAHPSPVVTVPALDLTVTGLVDVDDLGHGDVAFAGGTAANVGELRDLGGDVIVPGGFVIPMVEYKIFSVDTGFEDTLIQATTDPSWDAPSSRMTIVDGLQQSMASFPVQADLVARVEARIAQEFPGAKVRFIPSTNAEDLAGCASAGMHTIAIVDPADPQATVERAIRAVWAGLWSLPAVEERERASIPHLDVGMAILVQPVAAGEPAAGVAVTANLYDPAPGGEDAFIINAQPAGGSVAQPAPGELVDALVYYYFHNGQPATYYAHSSLVPEGGTVLTRFEMFQLGRALDAIRSHFRSIFAPPAGYGALPMEVEWKVVSDEDGDGTHIEITQARPYPGRGE